MKKIAIHLIQTLSLATFTAFASFAFSSSAFSQAIYPQLEKLEKLEKQREIYQKLNEILQTSSSENTQQLANQLLIQLKDYPLYPYAEYQLLQRKKSLNFAEIQDFENRNPDFPLLSRLKNNWAISQYNQQNWTEITAQSAKLAENTTNQCILLQAQQAQLNQNSQNNQNSPENLIKELWLSGKALPTQCLPLIEEWHTQGGLTPELAYQRGLQAFEQKNVDALKQLQQQLKDPENQQKIAELSALLASPEKLTDPTQPFYVENLVPSEENKRILVAIMPAFIKKLNEKNTALPVGYFSQLENWAKKFGLNEKDLVNWKQAYLSQFFDVEDPTFRQWRDTQLNEIKEDRLTERRIRMAIREKADLKPWLNLLSNTAQQKEEWQYWIAQNTPEKKQQILTALSTQRHFFGMVASQELGIPYQPKFSRLEQKPEKVTAEKATTEKQSVPVEKRFAIALARITELRHFKDFGNMNSEWNGLLKSINFEEKLQLAHYANQQHWYELAVESTIQAKAWGYIDLRLPNAYADWFDIHLNNKKIHRTFAMAIARQESAWRPNVSSSANARGLMQLLPSTAKQTAEQLGLPYSNEQQLFEPFYNIMLGTAHLQQLYDKYGNNRILIAAAYNAGAHRVDQWLARSQGKLTMAEFVSAIPFFETRGYVQNVLAYDSYYQILLQQPQELFSKEERDRLY